MPMAEPPRSATSDAPILSVRDLVIEVPSPRGVTRLLDGASFDVHRGEVFGVVGESGSGKSLTMLAVMGLLPHPLKLVSGSVTLNGRELTGMGFEAMRGVRGKTMSMIFQDPMTSLNPVLRVSSQIGEAVRLHQRDMSERQVMDRVVELLDLVGIADPDRRARQFPHEFSGGMRQRVMIAMAIANEPDLLIADEPTTALDVTIQAQIMSVLARVRARTGAAMVLITHDLGLVAEVAHRVAVMYAGRMVERAQVDEVFKTPRHPYTVGLLASLPHVERNLATLYSIPGHVPDLSARPAGCAFHPRCAMSGDREACGRDVPAFRPLGEDHRVACHFAEETPRWADKEQRHLLEAPVAAAQDDADPGEPVLKVDGLSKDFFIRRHSGWGHDRLRAVRDVSFGLHKGRTLGLVGESGCGKSTLGRIIMRLIAASSGAVQLKGRNIARLEQRLLRPLRPQMQVIFQDPYASLDPRMTVHEIVAEPLRINRIYTPERVSELLAHVGLTTDAAARRPPEFSGGQRQRIAIARALALNPDIVVLDEAVSALDVSIQAQVVNLLKQLQAEMGLAYLFISHDLSVVRHISDQVAVMYLGRLVEMGDRDQVFDSPAHPYTQALLSAIPRPDPEHKGNQRRIVLSGDLPNPLDPPSGCPFRTRCSKATEICARTEPDLTERSAPGHFSACHHVEPPSRDSAPAVLASAVHL